MEKIKKVAVIGGGAAGFFAALSAKSHHPEASVILFEKTSKVLAKVKELTGKDAEIESIIDESILGGFILRVGDIQYNASIANKLSKLKREFTLN